VRQPVLQRLDRIGRGQLDAQAVGPVPEMLCLDVEPGAADEDSTGSRDRLVVGDAGPAVGDRVPVSF